MEFYIEKIKIELLENEYGLQLKTAYKELPLPGQNFADTMDILRKNFEVVKGQYIKTASTNIESEELNEVCMRIVLHYFYLYNSWKYSNEKEKDRDLTFLAKDFKHPNSMDIIIQYFKNKYPKDYAGKCASILGITAEELLKYENNNNEFYSSFR
ncbi:MAG: hypothetical protein IPG12_13260 [Saprospiraceae bacterium]|nr:hypothetical protein [Saprospiraceae bacterium]